MASHAPPNGKPPNRCTSWTATVSTSQSALSSIMPPQTAEDHPVPPRSENRGFLGNCLKFFGNTRIPDSSKFAIGIQDRSSQSKCAIEIRDRNSRPEATTGMHDRNSRPKVMIEICDRNLRSNRRATSLSLLWRMHRPRKHSPTGPLPTAKSVLEPATHRSAIIGRLHKARILGYFQITSTLL